MWCCGAPGHQSEIFTESSIVTFIIGLKRHSCMPLQRHSQCLYNGSPSSSAHVHALYLCLCMACANAPCDILWQDDLDFDDDEIEIPPQPSGAVRVAAAGESSGGLDIWDGKAWAPMMSPEAIAKDLVKKDAWFHVCLVASTQKPVGITLFVNGQKQLTVPCRCDSTG